MSKASEWAKMYLEGRPIFRFSELTFSVSDKGNFSIEGATPSTYIPPDALRLAHWILDTFGEPDGPA